MWVCGIDANSTFGQSPPLDVFGDVSSHGAPNQHACDVALVLEKSSLVSPSSHLDFCSDSFAAKPTTFVHSG